MNEMLIIKIVFGLLLSIGSMILIILSFLLGYKYLIQEKRCTVKTSGIIKKYTLTSRGGGNSGVHLPIVFYTVNGKEYKVVGPKYKFYKTINRSNPLATKTMDYKEEDQILTINRKTNSVVDIYNNPIENMYPINSKIDVYYDPNNPQLSYVLRYCNNKWIFWLMFISGLLLLLLEVLMFILL